MKKAICIILMCAALLLTACGQKIKIKEQVFQQEDGTVIYYPVVDTGNPGVNKTINKEIENAVFSNEESTDQGYTALENKDLLSIFIEGATETDSYIKTLHINTKTGKVYSLYDLVNKDKKEELEKLVNEELNNVLLEFKMVYKPNVETVAFDAYDRRLVFIFSPGDVAPTNMGFIDVVLDFDRIEHILNKSGELYKLVS